MWYRIKAWLTDPDHNLWIMPTIGVIFALVFSLAAAIGNRYLAEDAVPSIAAETLSSLLDIIASSMLTVTTFSLSIMVTALGSTSDNATPRARVFVVADDSTRLTIASFVSALFMPSSHEWHWECSIMARKDTLFYLSVRFWCCCILFLFLFVGCNAYHN